MSGWRVEWVHGPADAIHARPWPAPLVPTVWVCTVARPALVLGSAQRDVVDAGLARDHGIDVVRRRSGGGAVWLVPGGTVWVDVFLPRGDPRWDDDVGRAANWLGAAWAEAIGGGAVVHRGRMIRTALSDRVCFAGVAPGEVVVDRRKAVGISQRRTRAGARFQCVAYERWEPEPLAGLLRLTADEAAAVATAGASLGARLTGIEEALLRAMS